MEILKNLLGIRFLLLTNTYETCFIPHPPDVEGFEGVVLYTQAQVADYELGGRPRAALAQGNCAVFFSEAASRSRLGVVIGYVTGFALNQFLCVLLAIVEYRDQSLASTLS
jgi:hypothetical protein